MTVTLFDVTAGVTVGTTATDANGDYLFNNGNVIGGLLPNHAYEVRIAAAQAKLAGLVLTRANQPADPLVNSKAALVGGNAVITLTTGAPGQIDHTFDAGFEPLAQVAGVVFDNSIENDGVFHAATDPGINGVTVTLTGTDDLGNPVSLTTTTSTIAGQAGSYVFTGLRPSNGGGYIITETGVGVPATFIDGKDSVPGSLGGNQASPTADQVTAIVVRANANGVNYNFGEIRPAQVAGVVFDNSIENDGVFHAATDPGINGVIVTLTGTDDLGNPVSLTTTTSTIAGQAGSYVFAGLRPSNAAGYIITETGTGVPAIFTDGKDSVPGSLGGNQASQRADQVTAIPVTAGANGVNYNFGEIKPAQVAGVVFDNSVENDGVFHALTDPGINGVTVTLTGADDLGNPVSLTTTTTTIAGQAGSYVFTGLRPSNGAGYIITETGTGVPATFIDGKDSVPGSLGGNQANQRADQITSIPVTANTNGVNYNFGEVKPAQVAGVVFDNTVEDDGVFHAATDPGINGVTVTLTGTDDLGNPVSLSTTTTTIAGQAGSYVFTGLRPSNGLGYTITETGTGVPATFIDGKDSVPGSLGGQQANQTADQVTAIPVTANSNGVNYNFGEIKPAQVAGVVFDNSIENDGVFHAATDPGINGVTVTLTGTDDLGNPVSLTTTTSTIAGQAGAYVFTGLRPSYGVGYIITETGAGVPATFTDGKDSVPGSLGGNQANQRADQVTAIPVNAGANGVNYNFGEIVGGLPAGVVPPLADPTGPEVDPTFISKTLLLGSGMDGALVSNIEYVNILYHQVLGRVADVDGLNAWVFQLDAGVSRTQVADEIWRSPEHRGLQVDQFYLTFLHRTADPAGRAGWVNFFLSGASETDVAAAFLTSGEYQATHASAAAFAAGLYQDALNRPADASGLAAWEAVLGSGASREQVALEFLTSAESSQGVPRPPVRSVPRPRRGQRGRTGISAPAAARRPIDHERRRLHSQLG